MNSKNGNKNWKNQRKRKIKNEQKETTSSTVARFVCDKLIRFKVLNAQTISNTKYIEDDLW